MVLGAKVDPTWDLSRLILSTGFGLGELGQDKSYCDNQDNQRRPHYRNVYLGFVGFQRTEGQTNRSWKGCRTIHHECPAVWATYIGFVRAHLFGVYSRNLIARDLLSYLNHLAFFS